MKNKAKNLIIVTLLISNSIFIILLYRQTPITRPLQDTIEVSDTTKTTEAQIPLQAYTVKQFDLAGNISGLSKEQIEQHEKLYAGYVKKRNEIMQALKTVDRTDAANRTYSPFRALKIAETYAVNGALLHELYFQNLGIQSTTIGPRMKQLVVDNFGSLEAFKNDFMDCGGCARGWVVTAYSIDDGRLHNFVLEEHNQNVPVMIIPLLVLDVYEHAYMIDYGIARNPYLQVFWNHIAWNVIEERIIKLVEPLRKEVAT